MKIKKGTFTIIIALLSVMQPGSFLQAQSLKKIEEKDLDNSVKEMLNRYDKCIYFTQNNGQWPSHVLYKADFRYGQAVATKKGMMIGTFDPASVHNLEKQMEDAEKTQHNGPAKPIMITERNGVKGHGWLMEFLNASPLMTVESNEVHHDKYNYLIGNDPSKYAKDVNNYQEIWYKNVYDNIDVRYYPSEEGTLEYDIICKPGFDKNKIAIQYEGIDKMYTRTSGELVLNTSVGNVTFPRPIAYQLVNGKRSSVEVGYLVTGNKVRYKLGKYDKALSLLIDPIALRWATWVTNSSTASVHAHGIWIDQTDGSIYTLSRLFGSNLITVNPFQAASGGSTDVCIGKYTQPASVGGAGVRVWQTYFGGNGSENPFALEQGPDGNIYFVGAVGAGTTIPILSGPAFSGSSVNDGAQAGDNIFITKMSPDGHSVKTAIVGGNGTESVYDLRITPAGDVLFCGYTNSTNLSTAHPGLAGAVDGNNGGTDVIVCKINADLSSLYWLQNYGGSNNDQANIMVSHPVTGDIYIGGSTASTNFPLALARQGSKVGTTDGFLQKLNSSGIIQWSSYFNSSSSATATNILCLEFNIAKDSIYFGGVTSGLATTNVSGAGITYDDSYNGGNHDLFVCRTALDQTFDKGTYVGGSGDEVNMMGLNVDLNNDVYVLGYTNSYSKGPNVAFPTTANAIQTNNYTTNGNFDATFTKLSSDLKTIIYSTYYGGTGDEYDPLGERGIKFYNCRIYTVITAYSNDIPLTNGAITTSKLSISGTLASGSSGVSESSLQSWANPPDLNNNFIAPTTQVACSGSTPADITGSVPTYSLPTLIRNGVTSAYPVLTGSGTFQWQMSIDNINWTDIAGATSQNLLGSSIGPISQTTYIRRIIGGDACVIDPGLVSSIIVDCVLPTNLLQFKAVKNKAYSLLTWQTTQETNNDHFDIERSSNGTSFIKIGEVAGSGYSTVLKNYSYSDRNPVVGLDYYRLKQMDTDYKYKYSAIRTVRFDGQSTITLFPNPSNSKVFITDESGSSIQSVTVYTVEGIQLKQYVNFKSGNSIDVSGYAKGIYLIKLKDIKGSIIVQKLIRQ